MKKIAYLMLGVMMVLFACKKDKKIQIHTVTVQLEYPVGGVFTATEGVTVKMAGKSTVFEAQTNAEGKATFSVPTDIYEISATDSRVQTSDHATFNYNAVKSNVAILDGWNSAEIITLELEESKASQIVIKEVFVGGTPKDDGSGAFTYDRYVILYNNSDFPASLGNMSLATTMPYNSTGTNKYYTGNELSYKNEGWMPAGQAIWHFKQNVVVQPWQQIVIALTNAVNNTLTYSKSINFDNSAYYATYDPDVFTHTATYPTPAASIPTSNYLKAIPYGAGTAWTLSVTSPGFFIFDPKDTTPAAFVADASSTDSYTGTALVSKKVPVDWIVDGVEAFELGNTGNNKRFLPTVDAGYVYHINKEGYSIYRNVDEAATKAIPGNEAKLVYGYSLGTTITDGSTDPSGIDAESSIKNGARIVYKDTNNSSNDFHLRSKASLRTN